MLRIILASGSPRRRELLGKLYDNFEVITSEVDETLDDGMRPIHPAPVLVMETEIIMAVRELIERRFALQ